MIVLLALRQIVFLALAILIKHKWVILRERRRS